MINENTSSTADSTDVSAALTAILTTDKFAASPQMSAFLKYVVEQTLMGNTRRIKAFTVGIEALGKSPNFDPQTDPSVRVLAKRLRSSLDVYYENNPQTPVFIEMKPGSYIPKFILRSEMNMETAPQIAAGYGAMADGSASGTGGISQDAHYNVQHPETKETTVAETTPSESEDDTRKANMNKLWQAYRSSSKVA